MPIGTIIGFLVGALLASTIVLWAEVDNAKTDDSRKTNHLWLAEHRSRYLLWWLGSLFALAGTFIEMLLS